MPANIINLGRKFGGGIVWSRPIIISVNVIHQNPIVNKLPLLGHKNLICLGLIYSIIDCITIDILRISHPVRKDHWPAEAWRYQVLGVVEHFCVFTVPYYVPIHVKK